MSTKKLELASILSATEEKKQHNLQGVHFQHSALQKKKNQ